MGGRSGMEEVAGAQNAPAIEERGLSLYSLTTGAYRFFCCCSSFTHRYKRPTQYFEPTDKGTA